MSSITPDKIHAAADEIAATGQRPTLSRVRAALGGGSFSTISEAMQSWRVQQTEEHALAEIQVPDALADRVQQLQAAAWQTAIAEAERRLSVERESLAEAQESAAGQIAEAVEAVETLEGEAEERNAEIAALKTDSLELNKQLAEAHEHCQQIENERQSERSQLTERIDGLEQRLTDANEARKNADAREKAAAENVKTLEKKLASTQDKLTEAQQKITVAETLASERQDALKQGKIEHEKAIFEIKRDWSDRLKMADEKSAARINKLEQSLNNETQYLNKTQQQLALREQSIESLNKEIERLQQQHKS